MVDIFDEHHEFVETEEVIGTIGTRFTERSAKRLLRRSNSGRPQILGIYTLRYEVRRRGMFKHEVVAIQNKWKKRSEKS